jgi:hypothetical protein
MKTSMKTRYYLMFTYLALFSLAEILVSAATIDIPNSTGKFDFLRIDPKRGRLLAAHENDGTADYIDMRKNMLITRLKVGGAVDPVTRAVWTTYTDGKNSFAKAWMPPKQ